MIIHIFTCINNSIERHRTKGISQYVQTVEWSWSADVEVVATMWMEQQVHSRMKDLGHVRAERRWQQSECATATDTHTKTVLCTHLELWNFEVINYGTYIFLKFRKLSNVVIRIRFKNFQIQLPNFGERARILYLFSQIQPTHKILVIQILI